MINRLITKVKGLIIKGDDMKKLEIEGYLLQTDNTRKQSLLLVKEHEKCWKAKWFDNTKYIYNTPSAPISSIFK